MSYHDHRYLARDKSKWYQSLDEVRMKATVVYYNDEDEEVECELPFEYAVCPTCDGKGKHVNPDIDSHGISADEFYEDPDFGEDYFDGVYDVQCYGCDGRRVVAVVDERKIEKDSEEDVAWKAIQKKIDDDESYARERAWEREMGC